MEILTPWYYTCQWTIPENRNIYVYRKLEHQDIYPDIKLEELENLKTYPKCFTAAMWSAPRGLEQDKVLCPGRYTRYWPPNIYKLAKLTLFSFKLFLMYQTDLETRGKRRKRRSREISRIWGNLGGNHSKLSYSPGFTKQNYLVFGEILYFPSLGKSSFPQIEDILYFPRFGDKICMFCREMTHF